MSKRNVKRNECKPEVHVMLCYVNAKTQWEAHPIARAAAARALSGREMSAVDVWRAVAPFCCMHDANWRCDAALNRGGRCHVGICPRLRGGA